MGLFFNISCSAVNWFIFSLIDSNSVFVLLKELYLSSKSIIVFLISFKSYWLILSIFSLVKIVSTLVIIESITLFTLSFISNSFASSCILFISSAIPDIFCPEASKVDSIVVTLPFKNEISCLLLFISFIEFIILFLCSSIVLSISYSLFLLFCICSITNILSTFAIISSTICFTSILSVPFCISSNIFKLFWAISSIFLSCSFNWLSKNW